MTFGFAVFNHAFKKSVLLFIQLFVLTFDLSLRPPSLT